MLLNRINKILIPYRVYLILLLTLAILFSILSFSFLTRYPLAHIDEAWYSNTTYNLFHNGTMNLTIYKYRDCIEGYHFGKLHLAGEQLLFSVFGYSLFAARLISLFSILGSCVFLYFIMMKLSGDKILSCLSSFILLTSEQVVYASHLARPEALLTFWFLLCLLVFLTNYNSQRWYTHFAFGLLCGLSFEIHFNALILCFTFLMLYLFFVPSRPAPEKIKRVCQWGAGIILIFAVWYWGRFWYSPHFFKAVSTFAQEKSFGFNPFERVWNNILYFYNIIQKSEYYRKVIDFTFFAITISGTLFLLRTRKASSQSAIIYRLFLLILAAIDIGLLLMGMYNRHYILLLYPFIIPLGALFLIDIRKYLPEKAKILPIAFLISFCLINIAQNIYLFYVFRNADFDNYITNIKRNIPPGSIVIGDLAYEYGFHNYDYIASFDLTDATSQGKISIEKYFDVNKIDYIIYNQYWDYMSKNQIDYGTVNYKELQKFLERKCVLVTEIKDYCYGMTYRYWGNCWTKIYKVAYESR